MKFSTKLVALLVTSIVMFAVLVSIVATALFSSRMESAQDEWVSALNIAIAEGIIKDAADENVIHARDTLNAIVEAKEAISYAYVVGFSGEVFAHSFKKGFPRAFSFIDHNEENHFQERQYQLDSGVHVYDEVKLLVPDLSGHLHIGVNHNFIDNIIWNMGRDIVLMALVVAIVVGMIGFWYSRKLVGPLEVLSERMKLFGAGESEEMLELVSTEPEFRSLENAFNDMLRSRSQSREQLRQILSSIAEGVVGVDSRGRCSFVNPAACEILGYSSATDLNGRDILEVLQPVPLAESGNSASQLQQLLLYASPLHVDDETFRCMSGDYLEIEYWVNPVVSGGDEQKAVITFVDISTRRRDQRALLKSQQMLLEAQSIARLGHWELDLSENALFWSDEVFRIFEIDKRKFGATYEAFVETIHPEDRNLVSHAYENSLKTREPYQIVHRLKMPDGRVKYVRESCETTFNENNEPLVSIGTVQDITENVLAERELKRHRDNLEQLVESRTEELEVARDQALEATRVKSEFLANMSHELRTPLNSIIGFTGILRDGMAGAVNEIQKKQLGMVYSSAQHLLELINEVLDLSKVEAGKVELFLEKVELNAFLEELVGTLIPQALEKGIELKLVRDQGIGVIVTDRAKLRQVMINLVANAIKFTVEGEINVSVFRREGRVVFEISDTGIGIAKEDVARVFDAFQQVDSVDTRSFQGTGLGLTICKNYVELLGGLISVESELGIGSTFRIDFSEQPRRYEVEDAGEGGISTDYGRSVMVVEDDPFAENLLRNYLERFGYDVIWCKNATEAVDMACVYQPKLILLDILMPKQNGWVTLAELKNEPSVAHIPVVITSVLDDVKIGASLGAADYLQKPFEAKELKGVLDTVVRRAADRPVLIVEDDDKDAEYLKAILSKNGLACIRAVDGVSALSMVKEYEPSIILLDLLMPRMNGFEFIEKVKEYPGSENLAIIVISAHEPNMQEVEYLEGNVLRVYRKGTFEYGDILGSVNQVMSIES